MSDRLNIGVLGVSNHFIKRIVLPAKEQTNINLVAVASRDESKAKTAAKQFDLPTFYGSYEALLEDKSIDAVYIPLPNHMHAEWIKKAADAGKHILCEKPMCMTAEEAVEAFDYCREKGVRLMEAFMYKHHPQWQKVRDIIRTNNIGKVNYIHTSFSYNNPSASNIRNIREYGGGGLRDIGCYAISVARFLLDREPVRVVSKVNQHAQFETDMLTSTMMDFGQSHASFTVSTVSDAFQNVDIIASAGHITIHLPFNTYTDVPAKVTVVSNLGSREIEFPAQDQYGLMIRDFADAVLHQKPFLTDEKDTINNQRVIDAIINSCESKAWEDIITTS